MLHDEEAREVIPSFSGSSMPLNVANTYMLAVFHRMDYRRATIILAMPYDERSHRYLHHFYRKSLEILYRPLNFHFAIEKLETPSLLTQLS